MLFRSAFSATRRTARLWQKRGFASHSGLFERIQELVPEKQAELKDVLKSHGDKILGEVTVAQCVGGARGVKCMLWDTSLLDSEEGIRFRGHTIPELQQKLPGIGPSPMAGEEPLPESLLWYVVLSVFCSSLVMYHFGYPQAFDDWRSPHC